VIAFVCGYIASAAILAVWVDLRFPPIRPRTWGQLGIATGAAFLFDSICTAGLRAVSPLIGVIGIGLPLIGFSLLVCLWALRMMRSAMPGH
jgi:hypothetical protein